jgi:hypothetical protein
MLVGGGERLIKDLMQEELVFSIHCEHLLVVFPVPRESESAVPLKIFDSTSSSSSSPRSAVTESRPPAFYKIEASS